MGKAGIIGKALTKAGSEITQELGQQIGKRFGPNSAQMSLGHRLFGKVIPEEVAPILKKPTSSYSSGIDDATAFTLSKAIDLDPEVRAPVETLFRMMGDGDDNAYEVMARMVEGFDMEDSLLRQKMAAQKKMSGVNKVYGDAQKEKKIWNKRMDEIDQATTLTGDTGRAQKNNMQTGYEGPGTYTSSTKFERLGRMITNMHHALGLDDAFNVIKNHSSYAGVTPDSPKSPIIQAREEMLGVKSGNYEQNMVDILDRVTGDSRAARKQQLNEMSGGVLDLQTINDMLGTSGSGGSKTNKPLKVRELTKTETGRLESIRQDVPDVTVDEFMDTKLSDSGRGFGKDTFPEVRVNTPDGKTLLETLTFKNGKEYANRLKMVFDVLEKNGIDTSAARKNTKMSKLQIDPKLDIHGEDHPLVHSLINALKEKPGTALNKIQELGPDGIYNLSLDDAVKLDFRSLQEMETVLANVLQYRYNQLVEVFEELNPDLSKGYFETLSAGEKQTFFKENMAKVAVKGDVQKAITLENALKPIDNWNNHIADTFGWSPQALWADIDTLPPAIDKFARRPKQSKAEVEEWTKELQETVPTTMPIPGVE